ncbi:hypothetical protein RY831_29440 [Noviherbaspirillum sp. CPCC 100848]|uniref:Ribbon-helix-helix protein CopG domain-containing protein n=1 Tax=Noviherbaspirillum album TaxID=3080276 RepID=A0ABU6JIE0_9BURK|nr:hypothetical protein [Noviherbaspirillum sp. CPCC 100848]MEC4723285.1 hypothetical protein [Noviherbaspirillum sp. CPCC 100848]
MSTPSFYSGGIKLPNQQLTFSLLAAIVPLSFCIANIFERIAISGRKKLRNAVHLQHKPEDHIMKRLKDETLSIRTSSHVKQLLRIAAEREHRSIASMMEILILAYAEQHSLEIGADAEVQNKG